MRFNHIIQPNKRITCPGHFIFFDTETTQVKINKTDIEHKFRLGMACYWRNKVEHSKDVVKWVAIKDPEVFWDFVVDRAYKNKTLYLVAHNVDFDMKVLAGFKAMRERGFTLTFFVNNGLTKIWLYHNNQRRIVFIDNLNFFNITLKQLGNDIGLAKLSMPKVEESDLHWQIYCHRDVEILLRTWQQFLNFLIDNDLGSFKPTIASQSFNAFRHRFMKHKIFITVNEKVTELERESYHGGRVECFFIGQAPKQNYYLLDINSMYPFLMKKEKYPIKFLKYNYHLSLFELKIWLEKYSVIARVKVKMKDPIFPARIDKKLCFPIGTFETVLTTNELKEAIKRHCLVSIQEGACYEKAAIFRDYIDYFYQQRLKYGQQHNQTYSFITKLFMNSLYGKFGQKNDVWKYKYTDENLESGYWNELDLDNSDVAKYRCIEGRVEEKIGEEEAYNSFAAVASEVCANARLKLWYLITKAGRENVFYCDTDSLIVNEQGKALLGEYIFSGKLGFLKLEQKSKDLIIFAPKYYRFGDLLKIKGVRQNAKMIDDYHFEDWQFIGVKGALRRRDLNRQLMVKVNKSLKQEYTKGRVLKSGKVLPYDLHS